MKIELKKFGETLISRQAGKEAFLAFSPVLKDIKPDEKIDVDFDGVVVFSPSWADEFLTQLLEKFPKRVFMKNTENPSVAETLKLLKSIGKL